MKYRKFLGSIVIVAIYSGGGLLSQNSISIDIWTVLPQPTAMSAA